VASRSSEVNFTKNYTFLYLFTTVLTIVWRKHLSSYYTGVLVNNMQPLYVRKANVKNPDIHRRHQSITHCDCY